MLRLLPLLAVLGATVALVGAASCGGKSDKAPVLRFSAIPDEDITGFVAKFQPVAAYLSDALGVEVEYVHSESYPASVENFRRGDIHLAWFGGLTGVQARHFVPGANAIVQGQEDPEYFSYFIAHRDTGLSASDDFPVGAQGMTFSFGSKSSTSGRLMPEYFITKRTGKAPDAYFGSVVYSGNHDKTVEWVESGQAQVGALSYKVYDARVASGKTDPDVVKVIWKTPVYADYNFTAHPDLEKVFGAGFTKKLTDALLAMKDENLLAAFKRSGFIPAKNAEFEAIGAIAKDAGFLDG